MDQIANIFAEKKICFIIQNKNKTNQNLFRFLENKLKSNKNIYAAEIDSENKRVLINNHDTRISDIFEEESEINLVFESQNQEIDFNKSFVLFAVKNISLCFKHFLKFYFLMKESLESFNKIKPNDHYVIYPSNIDNKFGEVLKKLLFKGIVFMQTF